MAINFSFLREVEGFETEGYVPKEGGKAIENSGVTVGSGIDLGQWKKEDLAKMGVPSNILKKLTPYFGKKKDEAIDALSNDPLSLEKEEAEKLTSLVKKGYANKVKGWYNRNNKVDNDWSDLTDRQQTAITSVYFQYGVGSNKTPNFNKQVLANDWQGVVKNLRNFGDRYDNRRHKELQYLVGAPVDGEIGPNTEAAIDQFVNTTGMTTPDAPTEAYPQITSMGFTDNLTAMLQELTKASQAVPQPPATADTEVRLGESEDAAAERGATQFTEEEEALIQAAVSTPEEEKTSEEPDWTPQERMLLERATGTVETAPPVRGEKVEGRDDSKDPIYGIF